MSNVASNIKLIPQSLLHGRYKVVEVPIFLGWETVYIVEDLYRAGFPKRIIQEIQPISNEGEFWQGIKQLFNYEVQILRILNQHDQISQLLDYLEVEGIFYLVQEFVVGEPLSRELYLNCYWCEERVISLLNEVLPILALVHSQGMIHGNLNPEQIIRRASDGKLVLTGLTVLNQMHAEFLAFEGKISSKLARGGLGYISVEQMRGILRPSSDIYALGAMAIQALTGLNPFQLEENRETGELVWQNRAKVSEEFAAIISQMVSYHFGDRYQSATDVLVALESLGKAGNLHSKSTVNLTANPTKHNLITQKATSVATSIAFSAGGYFLMSSPYNNVDRGLGTLTEANQKYQAGDLPEAVKLAESIDTESIAYPEAQTAIIEWQTDWQKAQLQFYALEKLFEKNQWSDVLTLANQMPDIAFWQQKIVPIVSQAQANLEEEAYQLLQQAYDCAIEKDFTTALDYLNQIPPNTKAYAKVQTKIAEYSEKKRIKAEYLLQQAYSRATTSDFTGALQYLKQIPQDTATYAKAQQKIIEYQEKQQIKNTTRLTDFSTTKLANNSNSQEIFPVNSFTCNPGNKDNSLSPGSHLQEVNPSEMRLGCHH